MECRPPYRIKGPDSCNYFSVLKKKESYLGAIDRRLHQHQAERKRLKVPLLPFCSSFLCHVILQRGQSLAQFLFELGRFRIDDCGRIVHLTTASTTTTTTDQGNGIGSMEKATKCWVRKRFSRHNRGRQNCLCPPQALLLCSVRK